jgi:hypothetical protein
MKQIAIFSFICLALGILFTTSCKKSDNSIYFYNESRDTIAPIIQTNAPLNSEIFYYGDDIHIVGNVVDKETEKTSGKLKSLTIEVLQMNATYDTVKNNTPILLKKPAVDGKEVYTFNTKMLVNFGTEITYYRLLITTYDYSGRSASDTTKFSIQ